MAHRESHTCWKYLSQLMYSLSWESCSLLVLMYCQRAWMMQERVWVWMPSRRARRGSSLNWGGCGNDVIALQHFFFFFFFTTAHIRAFTSDTLIICAPPSPGSPASAAECIARSRLPAFSPGSRRSPGWWPCGATETANRHTLTTHPKLTGLFRLNDHFC